MSAQIINKYVEDIGKAAGIPVAIFVWSDKLLKHIPLTSIDDLRSRLYGYEMKVMSADQVYHVATFALMELPGCNAILYSYHSQVDSWYQRKGIGHLLNLFRIDLATYLGYTAVICTVRTDNVAQRKLLATNAWEDIFTFINKRSSVELAVSVIKL